jgi:hypothetical protein
MFLASILISLPLPSLTLSQHFLLPLPTFSQPSINIDVGINDSKPRSINVSLYNADMQVYKELMPEPKPARTCVGVAQLPAGGTDVEIEFVAYDG